jgi:hypothetical protein
MEAEVMLGDVNADVCTDGKDKKEEIDESPATSQLVTENISMTTTSKPILKGTTSKVYASRRKSMETVFALLDNLKDISSNSVRATLPLGSQPQPSDETKDVFSARNKGRRKRIVGDTANLSSDITNNITTTPNFVDNKIVNVSKNTAKRVPLAPIPETEIDGNNSIVEKNFQCHICFNVIFVSVPVRRASAINSEAWERNLPGMSGLTPVASKTRLSWWAIPRSTGF